MTSIFKINRKWSILTRKDKTVRVKSGAALVRIVLRSFLFLVLLPVVTANDATAEKSARNQLKEKYFLLGLVGYNYTDRHISDYTVNGAGGADVRLSSPTGGGSGITCCVRLKKQSIITPRVKVRWQYDGCVYFMKNDRTGATDWVRHYYYKEAEVDLQRADSGTPGYVETHFYPDGTVQVFSTDYFSGPRLILDPQRDDKSSFPKCKDDEKPKE
jgi:hypothetical protein